MDVVHEMSDYCFGNELFLQRCVLVSKQVLWHIAVVALECLHEISMVLQVV
jgi:hypothetical protein